MSGTCVAAPATDKQAVTLGQHRLHEQISSPTRDIVRCLPTTEEQQSLRPVPLHTSLWYSVRELIRIPYSPIASLLPAILENPHTDSHLRPTAIAPYPPLHAVSALDTVKLADRFSTIPNTA